LFIFAKDRGEDMSLIKRAAACLAVTALLGVAASPASADRLPDGSGQPVANLPANGNISHGVIHCQAWLELLSGQEFPKGTYPGVVVALPDGTVRDASPDGRDCPAA
jgi:hypothetical protein